MTSKERVCLTDIQKVKVVRLMEEHFLDRAASKLTSSDAEIADRISVLAGFPVLTGHVAHLRRGMEWAPMRAPSSGGSRSNATSSRVFWLEKWAVDCGMEPYDPARHESTPEDRQRLRRGWIAERQRERGHA